MARREMPLAFDIETTGLDPRLGHLVSLQWAQEGFPAVVVDARVFAYRALAEVLQPLLTHGPVVVGHNLKFDLLWVMEKLHLYPTRVYDTLLAEQLLLGLGRSDAKSRGVGLSLKHLTHKYLGLVMSKEERSWFIDLDKRPDEWNAPLPEAQVEYALADVRGLTRIQREQQALLRDRAMLGVARLEMRALPAIAAIEQAGIRVDVEGWRSFIAEKEEEAREIESQALEVFGGAILQARAKVFDEKLVVYQAWEEARDAEVERLRALFNEPLGTTTNEYQPPKWGEFKTTGMQMWRGRFPNPGKPKMDTSPPNLGSPTQLRAAFEQMGITVASTDSETLQRLEETHPEVHLLLSFRRAKKFVEAFGEALLQYVTPAGRIHPEYVQIGASTGRMSCTRPNWQQVPSKGDGKRLRQLVVAEPGYKLLTADFSNIELRILADITGDETMLRLFAEGLDLHSYTARMMFGLDEGVDVASEVVPGTVATYRYVAKTINFGLVYGMSASKLGRVVKVSKEEAEGLMESYFRLYPGVAEWMKRMRAEGVERLLSETLSGRQRQYTLPTLTAFPSTKNVRDIQAWREAQQEYRKQKATIERQAMNTPIQGTSADITKLALALLYESHLLTGGVALGRVVAVVHDEIVIEAKEAAVPIVSSLLASKMEDAAKTYLTRVTLPPVEVVVADYWRK